MKAWGTMIVVASALLAVAFIAGAADTQPKREQAQFSILLKGTVDIDADGSVDHYSIEGMNKLAPSIAGMLDKQVMQWKFEPVLADGKPVAAQTYISMRLLATPNGDGNYAAGIQSVWFSGGGKNGRPDVESGNRFGIRQKAALRYPKEAIDSGMAGTVYAALKIGPDGLVMDAMVEQVNLTISGTDVEMAKARRILGNNTLASLRKWIFDVPTQGDQAGKPYWIGILPVHYGIAGTEARAKYGEWEKYIPGPHTEVPWADPDGGPRQVNAGGVDALPAGELTLDSSGPRLLTPLTQG
ncbi:hypothetical protein GCM10025793_05040 [Lysobacter lycopersici]